MDTSISTTATIYSRCCYRFFLSETWFTENTSGLYICCAVFLPVQELLILIRLTGQKRAFTALLGKSVAFTGLALWHKKSKILFVSSFFAIQIMVSIVSNASFKLYSNPPFKLYSNPQDENLIHKSNEGIFLWGLCSSYGRTEEENVLIFKALSAIADLISHRSVLCKTSLTTFVLCWHKKNAAMVFYSTVICHLSPPFHPLKSILSLSVQTSNMAINLLSQGH